MNPLPMRTLCFCVVLMISFVCCFDCAGQTNGKTQLATKEQEVEIRKLIDQLVFENPDESPETLPVRPGLPTGRKRKNEEEYRKRYERCEEAFRKLSEFKELAFPFLLQHFGDERPSIPFRGHYAEHSVGWACNCNIYFQLLDRPRDYSSYGYARKGRDGEMHVKPYWEGSPFDYKEPRGLFDPPGEDVIVVFSISKWLNENKNLSYAEKQIKCLNWTLAKEKTIGACDAESYFQNILPLEIRILERRQETGADVGKELARLRNVLKNKIVSEIPAELLPDKPAHASTTNAPAQVVIEQGANQPASKP